MLNERIYVYGHRLQYSNFMKKQQGKTSSRNRFPLLLPFDVLFDLFRFVMCALQNIRP